LQSPWSPSPLADCPSPTGSDRSATFSPSGYSPVFPRHSRNDTPVSPLVSPPPPLEHENVFTGSNSSLLDSFQEGGVNTGQPSDSNDSASQCLDSLASLNLRSSREGLGSSSSLNSLSSPRLQQLKNTSHVFNFSNSLDISSSTFGEESMATEPQPPPPYEDHLPNQTSGPTVRINTAGTPTRHTRSVAI
jgi:hypothetical protein